MTIYDVITPTFLKILGIVTYGLFFLTILGGLLRKQLAPVFKKAYLPLHRTLGIVALGLATLHGGLTLIVYGI